MIYQNIDGTTKKAFRLGNSGLQLISGAIISGGDRARMYIKDIKSETEADKIHKIAYDTDIPLAYVKGIEDNKDGTYTFTVVNNGEISKITIQSQIGTTGVEGPSTSTTNAIALFDDETGKKIKDSQTVLSTEIDDSMADSANEKLVPTANAIIDYVGVLSEPLKQRLNGKLKETTK